MGELSPEEARRLVDGMESWDPFGTPRPLDVVEQAVAAARVAEAEQVARDKAQARAEHEEREARAWERFHNDPTRGGMHREPTPPAPPQDEPDPAVLAEKLAAEEAEAADAGNVAERVLDEAE